MAVIQMVYTKMAFIREGKILQSENSNSAVQFRSHAFQACCKVPKINENYLGRIHDNHCNTR